jgi:hypothetical protein
MAYIIRTSSAANVEADRRVEMGAIFPILFFDRTNLYPKIPHYPTTGSASRIIFFAAKRQQKTSSSPNSQSLIVRCQETTIADIRHAG